MTIVNIFRDFFNIVCLSGIIILTRHIKPFWQVVIGTALVILGLFVNG